MSNPWLKKNPYMSLWLSGAHAVAGSARSRASAETKRQAGVLVSDFNREVLKAWTGGLVTPAAKPKKRRR
jgi:hypothetical protein